MILFTFFVEQSIFSSSFFFLLCFVYSIVLHATGARLSISASWNEILRKLCGGPSPLPSQFVRVLGFLVLQLSFCLH